MSTASNAADWKASLDLDSDFLHLDVLAAFPDIDLPTDFIPTLRKILNFQRSYIGSFATPDGRNADDWIENIRPSLLKDGEAKLYCKVFEGCVDEVLEATGLPMVYYGITDGPVIRTTEVLSNEDVDTLHKLAKKMRERCTDEQLLRFAQEYWRLLCYMDLQYQLEAAQEDLDMLQETFEPILDVLTDVYEEESRDFVWSEENRKEDIEAANALEQRREKRTRERTAAKGLSGRRAKRARKNAANKAE